MITGDDSPRYLRCGGLVGHTLSTMVMLCYTTSRRGKFVVVASVWAISWAGLTRGFPSI